jgi:hypothetical protein
MVIDEQMISADSLEIEVGDTRKIWVTPVVLESPVNEITAAGTGSITDGMGYS